MYVPYFEPKALIFFTMVWAFSWAQSICSKSFTILGASGTADALRWLYTYRLSLIAQKIQKGSLYSEVHRRFMPFTFFGVLVPRDAEILLDMDNLHRLRYKGNLSPDLEFSCLISALHKDRGTTPTSLLWKEFRRNHFFSL